MFGAIFLGMAVFFAAGISRNIPIKALATLQASNVLIFTVSRIPQIISNFQNKSTGQLALLTFLLNFLGTIARVFTTLKELNGDIFVLSGSVIGCVLNGIILFQILLYGSSGVPAPASPTTIRHKKKAE